jgi:RNA polymerase sigma-70 factor (ECF subfamily)
MALVGGGKANPPLEVVQASVKPLFQRELNLVSEAKTKKQARREEFEREALVHLDLLYNSALRMTGSIQDAEDLVQETFVRAYKFFDKFKKGTNCKAWLFKIMKNNFINRFRKKAREPATVSFEQIEGAQGIEAEPAEVSAEFELSPDLDELVEDDIKCALDSLPLEFRMAVILSDISGFTYREIAEIMGTPIGTVRSRLSRARGVLQKKLHDLAVSKGIVRNK